MPKACPLLVSALNPQLGACAEWKSVLAEMTCICFGLHLVLESRPHSPHTVTTNRCTEAKETDVDRKEAMTAWVKRHAIGEVAPRV